MNDVKHIVVIGAGASGLMAAISAARAGASVVVLEHMDSAGRKLLLTGSGKCNFTNMLLSRRREGAELDLHTVAMEHFYGDPAFAERAITAFDAEDTVAFFRELGVEPAYRSYPYDDGIYVYPSSMESRSMLTALLSECERLGVQLAFSHKVLDISSCDDFCSIDLAASEAASPDHKAASRPWMVTTDRGDYAADAVIFAAGSNAAPRTGSDSSVYPLIKKLGHGFTSYLPALCGLKPRDGVPDELRGVRAEAVVSLHVYSDNDMMLYQSRGEVQLGSEGISGVCVMDLSRHAALALKRGYTAELSLRLLPWMSDAELHDYVDACICRQQGDGRHGCSVGDVLRPETFSGALPLKLSAYIAEKASGSGMDSAEAAEALLKDLRFRITKTAGFDHCQAASGGVSTLEVDPATMRSRLRKGIYFCGEMLDVDGRCGGYNLQFAWSTGHIAGENASRPEQDFYFSN